MKLLVIGSSGMLGHVTTLYLRSLGHHVVDVSKTRIVDSKTVLIDVLNETDLKQLLSQDFDAVINCAAMLVRSCEKNKSEAVRLNSWFPHRLEELLFLTQTKIIQVSSDGIFSGNNAPYNENMLCDSSSFYGKTKWLGEINNTKDLTIRGSFAGPDLTNEGIGLFNWFVQQSGMVTGYDGVLFNAVTSLEFAKFVDFALQCNIFGVYHLGANETVSKSSFIHQIKDMFMLDQITIIDDNHIQTDNTLLQNKGDIYQRKSYNTMLMELKCWMQDNRDRYPHYTFI